jgi:CcmD family protein
MWYYLGEILAQSTTSTQQSDGFGYVIAAFMVIWLFIAAYLFWLNRRQESLRREVEMLRQEQGAALKEQPTQKQEVKSQSNN